MWSKFLKKNMVYAKLFYVTIYKRLRFVVVNLRLEYINNISTLRRYITAREKDVVRKWDLFELLITSIKYGTRYDAIETYKKLMPRWEFAMNSLYDKEIDSYYANRFDDWHNLNRSRRRLKYLFKMAIVCASHLID